MECGVAVTVIAWSCGVVVSTGLGAFDVAARSATGVVDQFPADGRGLHQLSMHEQRYLQTVLSSLTGAILKTPQPVGPGGEDVWTYDSPNVVWRFVDMERRTGSRVCAQCLTMVGNARLQHLGDLLIRAVADGVPGDYLEAGVWRGGASIYAQAVLRTVGGGSGDKQKHNVANDGERRVYLCDSFRGLPVSTADRDHNWWHTLTVLSVGTEEVADNFRRFGLLDSRVRFVPGFFRYSLPPLRRKLLAAGRAIAVLRGDGDMYESFTDILYNLYELVSIGGFFVCDDCPGVVEADAAVREFRKHHGIVEPIQTIPGSVAGIYWQKQRAVKVDYRGYSLWNRTRRNESKEQSAPGLAPTAATDLEVPAWTTDIPGKPPRPPPAYDLTVSLQELVAPRVAERHAAARRMFTAFRETGHAVLLGTRAAIIAGQLFDEQHQMCAKAGDLRVDANARPYWAGDGAVFATVSDGWSNSTAPCLMDDRRSVVEELRTELRVAARQVLTALAEFQASVEGSDAASWLARAVPADEPDLPETSGKSTSLLKSMIYGFAAKGQVSSATAGAVRRADNGLRPLWTQNGPHHDPAWLNLVSESSNHAALLTRTPAPPRALRRNGGFATDASSGADGIGRPWVTVNSMEGLVVLPGLLLAQASRGFISPSCNGVAGPTRKSTGVQGPWRFTWEYMHQIECCAYRDTVANEILSKCGGSREAIQSLRPQSFAGDSICSNAEFVGCRVGK
eukprot:TRINITY_DN31365_c0_g1_i1.p1 TRINITY_DN31365_c0_g1~~TRINITY_DN31365_c0_g1_i1.p1  ORF type:complete len:734 (-),score=82.58 TRINITY_DN31365_c0_g1_i1:45-2246(-)